LGLKLALILLDILPRRLQITLPVAELATPTVVVTDHGVVTVDFHSDISIDDRFCSIEAVILSEAITDLRNGQYLPGSNWWF
jgi:hypothetical protein